MMPLISCTNKHDSDKQKKNKEENSFIIYSTDGKSDLKGESITPQLRKDLDSFFIKNSWDEKKKLTNEQTDSLFKSELSKK
jgi:hypothetical protein